MSNSLTRMFDNFGGSKWWIVVLFFLFLAFQDSWQNICITDWIPFLILLLIVCASVDFGEECCGSLENEYGCEC